MGSSRKGQAKESPQNRSVGGPSPFQPGQPTATYPYPAVCVKLPEGCPKTAQLVLGPHFAVFHAINLARFCSREDLFLQWGTLRQKRNGKGALLGDLVASGRFWSRFLGPSSYSLARCRRRWNRDCARCPQVFLPQSPGPNKCSRVRQCRGGFPKSRHPKIRVSGGHGKLGAP